MKRTFFAFLLLLLIITPFIASAGILTPSLRRAGFGSGLEANPSSPTTIQVFVGRIINAFLGLLGTIFLVLLVYAGYLWMTAGGNEEDVTKAKKLIAQALIGLAIVMGAYAISFFVTSRLETATGIGG